MSDNVFLKEKAAKRKSASKAVWLLLIVSAIIIAMIVKIATTGKLQASIFSGAPTSDDVYEVAKEFVRPTFAGSSVTFADEGYQFGKETDSVYVIRSTAKLQNGGGTTTNDFKIILKYHGGQPSKIKNWSVIDLRSY